jgi:hypothetical protein
VVRRVFVLGVAVAVLLVATASTGAADSIPTGQRVFHNSSLEPAYNAANAGQIGYFMEPAGKMNASPTAWAPIYVVVYPTGSTAATTFSCMHIAMGNDNCPSHGNAIAGLAAAREPAVYGGGVAGHDHVLDFPGGDDFNIAWEPTVVLFKSKADANEHVVTDARINELYSEGKVDLIPLPQATFLCAIVPQRIWDMATPVPNG